MAALVVKDKVLVGNSGGEFGVRGALTAVDAHSGKIVWKAFSAGSDKDCLIGPRFKPFYNQDKGQDLGIKSWPPDGWKIGGASVWGWISYDPATNLIFMALQIPVHGIQKSVLEITNGLQEFLPAMQTLAKQSGFISTAHTIYTTTMQ